MTPSTIEMMPDASTQPQPEIGRSEKAYIALTTPVTRNSTATSSVSETMPASGLKISDKPTASTRMPNSSDQMKPGQPVTRNACMTCSTPSSVNTQPASTVAASVAASGFASASTPPTSEITPSNAIQTQEVRNLSP